MRSIKRVFAAAAFLLLIGGQSWAADGDFGWASAYGASPGPSEGMRAAVDKDGNIISAAYFYGSATAGTINLTSAGGGDLMLVKTSPLGKVIWAIRAGGIGNEWVYGLATDSNGDIVVCGMFDRTSNLGGSDLVDASQYYDIFVAKYSGVNGAHIWSQRFGGTGDDTAYGLAIDSGRNIYITGRIIGTVQFGSFSLVPSGQSDAFICKLAPAGTVTWAKRLGGTGSSTSSDIDMGYGIVCDAAGNSYSYGTGTSPMDFGGGVQLTLSAYYLCKYDTNGNVVWAKALPAETRGLAIDSLGKNLAITGDFYGSIAFDANTISSVGFGLDMFVAQYSASTGISSWAKGYGGNNYDAGNAVAFDNSGNVAVGGWYDDQTNLGGALTTSFGGRDGFIAKYRAADGSYLWSHSIGSLGGDTVNAIVGAPSGEIYFTGETQYSATFGSTVLTSGPSESRCYVAQVLGAATATPVLHPSDTNSDLRINITELTAYANCWKSGCTTVNPPAPIPIDYVTKAGALWRAGEIYHYDSAQPCPSCWVSGN